MKRRGKEKLLFDARCSSSSAVLTRDVCHLGSFYILRSENDVKYNKCYCTGQLSLEAVQCFLKGTSRFAKQWYMCKQYQLLVDYYYFEPFEAAILGLQVPGRTEIT